LPVGSFERHDGGTRPLTQVGDRFNNAGVAGEGSREGWEDVDSKDPNAISKQMLESTYKE